MSLQKKQDDLSKESEDKKDAGSKDLKDKQDSLNKKFDDFKKTWTRWRKKNEALEQTEQIREDRTKKKKTFRKTKKKLRAAFAIQEQQSIEEPEESITGNETACRQNGARCSSRWNRNKTKKTKTHCARCWKIFCISPSTRKTDDGIKNDWCKQSAVPESISTATQIERRCKADWRFSSCNWANAMCRYNRKSTRK